MKQYVLREADNNPDREYTIWIKEDSIIHVQGNCVLRGQILLADTCHELRIDGDSLTIITNKMDVALGRRVEKHTDGTYTVSSSPLKILIDCQRIKLRSGIKGFAFGVYGAVADYRKCFTKKCKVIDVPLSAEPHMRFLPGTEKSYCPPSYVNDDVQLKRMEAVGVAFRWNDDCKDFVHQLVEYDTSTVAEYFLNASYAKLFMECNVRNWFATVTYLIWAYKFYRGVDFDYSLIRLSWLYSYKKEYQDYIEAPETIKYMIATDMFRRGENLSAITQFLYGYKEKKNNSKLRVTNQGIVLRDISVDRVFDLIQTRERGYNLMLSCIGGHTKIYGTYDMVDKYCFATMSKDIYEQFMSSMDIPTNTTIPKRKDEGLEMLLDYLKYMGKNIPAPVMREQFPNLLQITAQFLGLDDHTDENGIDLMALWKEYIEHVDSSATDYMCVIEDYLHRVPEGKVSDDQISQLYISCVDKIQDLINSHAQCTFLFTASYSYDIAQRMKHEPSVYSVYMWQACVAVAQALLVSIGIDIARIAPMDLFMIVNEKFNTEIRCEHGDEDRYEKAYKDLMTFGRSVNWNM